MINGTLPKNILLIPVKAIKSVFRFLAKGILKTYLCQLCN